MEVRGRSTEHLSEARSPWERHYSSDHQAYFWWNRETEQARWDGASDPGDQAPPTPTTAPSSTVGSPPPPALVSSSSPLQMSSTTAEGTFERGTRGYTWVMGDGHAGWVPHFVAQGDSPPELWTELTEIELPTTFFQLEEQLTRNSSRRLGNYVHMATYLAVFCPSCRTVRRVGPSVLPNFCSSCGTNLHGSASDKSLSNLQFPGPFPDYVFAFPHRLLFVGM